MRLLLAFVVGFVTAVPAASVAIRPPKNKVREQQQADSLHGTWVVVSMWFNGKKMDAVVVKDFKVIITSRKIVSMQKGKAVSESSYKLDLTKQPKQIESTVIQGPQMGKVSVAIFSVEGDILKLATSRDGKKAPGGFDGRDTPVVFVFKRQKG